jgi:hypothetical protein
VGFTGGVVLAIIGFLPRVCLVFLPVGLWIDRWLSRWASQVRGGSEHWARGLTWRMFLGAALTIGLAWVDYLVDVDAERMPAGLGTTRGQPNWQDVVTRHASSKAGR